MLIVLCLLLLGTRHPGAARVFRQSLVAGLCQPALDGQNHHPQRYFFCFFIPAREMPEMIDGAEVSMSTSMTLDTDIGGVPFETLDKVASIASGTFKRSVFALLIMFFVTAGEFSSSRFRNLEELTPATIRTSQRLLDYIISTVDEARLRDYFRSDNLVYFSFFGLFLAFFSLRLYRRRLIFDAHAQGHDRGDQTQTACCCRRNPRERLCRCRRPPEPLRRGEKERNGTGFD
jgi:hypothetical protein